LSRGDTYLTQITIIGNGVNKQVGSLCSVLFDHLICPWISRSDPERIIKITCKSLPSYRYSPDSLMLTVISTSAWGHRSRQERFIHSPEPIRCTDCWRRTTQLDRHRQQESEPGMERNIRDVWEFCSFLKFRCWALYPSNVRRSSLIKIQIFDNRKFRRRDQGEYFSLRRSFSPLWLKGFWESVISVLRMPSNLQGILQVCELPTAVQNRNCFVWKSLLRGIWQSQAIVVLFMGIYRLAFPSRLCRSYRLLVCPCPLLKPIKIGSRATSCLLAFCSTKYHHRISITNPSWLWENIV